MTGPERSARSSDSQFETPRATWMKTTSDSGRNVPVPRSTTSNGVCAAATAAQWLRKAAYVCSSTSVGGSRVMCVGIRHAWGSPKSARRRWR